VSFGGGCLVYSDHPESLTSKMLTSSGAQGGDVVEGVLYKETGKTVATHATSSDCTGGDFRIYLNHESQIPNEPKMICVVVTNPGSKPVTITRAATGVGWSAGDPVKAGQIALAAYEASRRHFTPVSHKITAKGAYAFCLDKQYAIEKSKSGFNEAVNAIIDASASDPVQVGIVTINQGNEKEFTANPLKYQFADNDHKTGEPKRTYLTDGSLNNPADHGHVRGTFPYDEETVKLPAYDLDAGKPWGMPFAGPGGWQYEPAVDAPSVINTGNYGVLYDVSVEITGKKGEVAQVLLNPRGGPFAGVVDVPSPSPGPVPDKPPIYVPNPQGKVTNLTCKDQAVGIGLAKQGTTYSVQFMTPGGSSGPDAVVLSPAYMTVNATFSWQLGSSPVKLSAAAEPLIVTFHAQGTATLIHC